MGERVQRVAELQAIFRLARGAKRLIRWQSHGCALVLAAAHGNGAGPADAPGRRELSEHNVTYDVLNK